MFWGKIGVDWGYKARGSWQDHLEWARSLVKFWIAEFPVNKKNGKRQFRKEPHKKWQGKWSQDWWEKRVDAQRWGTRLTWINFGEEQKVIET